MVHYSLWFEGHNNPGNREACEPLLVIECASSSEAIQKALNLMAEFKGGKPFTKTVTTYLSHNSLFGYFVCKTMEPEPSVFINFNSIIEIDSAKGENRAHIRSDSILEDGEKKPSWDDGGKALAATPPKSEYNIQATAFLADNGLKMRITLSNTKVAAWGETGKESGNHYRVTISGAKRKLTFDFWGSINDARNDEYPSEYDVLACISGDCYCPETFAEFCGEYGYEQDSIKALQTFRRCSAFAKRLRAFFTESELEQLTEIQ